MEGLGLWIGLILGGALGFVAGVFLMAMYME